MSSSDELPASFGLTTQIYNNHIKSALLLAGFPLLLLLLLFAIGGAFAPAAPWVCTHTTESSPVYTKRNGKMYATGAYKAGPVMRCAAQPRDFVTEGTATVQAYGLYAVGAAGAWFVIAYFFQGALMRAATGSKPVTRQEYPKIYNMLENLCISRGLPMPSFEIIDSGALNAFATGLTEKDYKIVLTRGLVETLPDDELESVIAHELTHIINRDVRLLVVSVIFVGIFSFLLEMMFRGLMNGLFRSSERRQESGKGRGGLIGLLIVLGAMALAYLLAIVIRFALSRKREYLADAGSVELTRNPDAMMRALQHISGHAQIDKMPAEAAQMCIENPVAGLFATHPPIQKRIAAIAAMTGAAVPMSDPADGAPKKGPWG